MSERNHIKPSFFVKSTRRYLQWCCITECIECGTRGKYEDMHPVNPCPMCGNKLEVNVGKWIDTSSKWKFWDNIGYWKTKDEEEYEKNAS